LVGVPVLVLVLEELTGTLGWSDAVMGGPVGASEAVDGPDDWVPVGLSDGVAVGSLVALGDAVVVGSVVGVANEAQKASMDVDPDAAAVRAANPGPVVASCCCRQSAHRSVTGRTGCCVVDVVVVDVSLVRVRACVDVAALGLALSLGSADGDDACRAVRSGIGAPIVRWATSCRGAGSRPV
jgi:hypothetical protein